MQFIFSAATVLYPSHLHCSGKEERAGKFDGNYLAVSLYNVEAGDVRGGENILCLNLEGQAAPTGLTREHLKLRGGWRPVSLSSTVSQSE